MMVSHRAVVKLLILSVPEDQESVSEDQELVKRLSKHLQILKNEGLISIVQPPQAGEDTKRYLERQLQTARIILPIISSDLLASEEYFQTYLPYAIQRAKDLEAYIFPILLRPVDYNGTDLGNFSILPGPRYAVTTWQNQDEAFNLIASEVRKAIGHIGSSSEKLDPLPATSKQPRLFMPADLPTDFVSRPKEYEQLKRFILQRSQEHPTAITAAFSGTGGFGKTTLALALCHDPEIQKMFPDGILWITLGEQPNNLIARIGELIKLLTHTASEVISLDGAILQLKEALADRICLLVIDDVWQADALFPFLQGGPQCVRLITTRNDWVLPEHAIRVPVDAMQQKEALQLLQVRLPVGSFSQTDLQNLQNVIGRLGEWPLLLTLVAGVISRRLRLGESLEVALKYVDQGLKKYGVIAFDIKNATSRKEAIARTIAVSLEQLDPVDIACYEELAIFPEDVAIPLATLSRFWEATAGSDKWDVEERCQRFADFSLLLSYNLQNRVIRLHDVMRSYLQERVKARLVSLHNQFLGTYHLSSWTDLPADEPYLWDYLATHLLAARRTEHLIQMLKDIHYLSKKIVMRGSIGLEQDFFVLGEAIVLDNELQILRRWAVQLAHVWKSSHTAKEIEMTFINYLLADEQHLQTLLTSWSHDISPPWFKARYFLIRPEENIVRTLQGHINKVNNCAFSSDGRFLLSCSNDETLKLWNATTGAEIRTLQGHTNWVNDCVFSPDGHFVLSCSDDETLKLWDAATGVELHTLQGHTDAVNGCAFSPDGRFLLSCSNDHTLKLWDATTRAEIHTLQGHTDAVNGCAFSPDGRFLLSCSDDETLKLWDTITRTELRTLQGHTNWINGCAFSSDGHFLLSCSDDYTLKLWDAVTGAEIRTLQGHTDVINGCAFSPDGCFLLSCSDDKTLKLWNATTGAEIRTLQGHTDMVNGCAFGPDGRFLLSCSNDKTLKLWDAMLEIDSRISQNHTGAVNNCVFSPDGLFLLSCSNDETLKLWDVTTGTELRTLQGHTNKVNGCAFSPDGLFLLSCSNDYTLKLWDATTGTELHTLQGHTNKVNGCAFSPDGCFLLSCSDDHELKLWDAVTGTELRSLHNYNKLVRACAFSPDGRFLLSCSNDYTLKLWDATTGIELRSLQGHTKSIRSCTFSSAGLFLLSCSDDHTLKLWDAATGAEQRTFKGHTDSVISCAFSPDGRFLLSCSDDHTLKLWNAATGLCMISLPLNDNLSCCSYSHTEDLIVVGGEKGLYFFEVVF